MSELVRVGARKLLEEAVETKVTELLASFAEQRLADGRQRIVRNGYLPVREIQTGVGAIPVHVPKVRDRAKAGVKFNSTLVPPYIRRAPSVEAVLPWLYLKGISTGDFEDALQALLGEGAKGLSPTTISRLKAGWSHEYEQWCQRSLAGKHYGYIWADGVYFDIRLAEARQCLLVVIGVTPEGHKEFLAIEDGYRESEQSWTELHQIWLADTRQAADEAFATFVTKYGPKYKKAVECLEKDREALLAFYDFPAEHWAHIRSTNPIESTFATIRLRTAKTRGCGSRQTALALVYKLSRCAEEGWRKLRGFTRLGQVIRGVKFVNGVVTEEHPEEPLAA